MIRVQFTYKTLTSNLPELFEKFAQSRAEQFKSTPQNIGITMLRKEIEEHTFIQLEIDYNSLEDYEARTQFERQQPEWNAIWFSDAIKHELISVDIYEKL